VTNQDLSPEWCIVGSISGGIVLRCRRCNAREVPNRYPMVVSRFILLVDQFVDRHRGCPELPKRKELNDGFKEQPGVPQGPGGQ